MILTLNVEEGRRVKKGDVLAVLESTDYEADVDRAKASVRLMRERLRELENGNRPEEIQQAEAELREAEAELVQLEADCKRTDELRKQKLRHRAGIRAGREQVPRPEAAGQTAGVPHWS